MNQNYFLNGESNNPETFLALYRQHVQMLLRVKHSKYLVPCRLNGKESGEKLELAALVKPDGDNYFAAFTHPDELEKWPYAHDKAVLLSFDELRMNVLNSSVNMEGIVIDPFSNMLIIGQNQIRQIDSIAEGFNKHCSEHDASRWFIPAEIIPELTEELNLFLRERSEVYSASVLMVQNTDSIAPVMLFIIDFDGHEIDLFPAISKIISRHMKQGEVFELVKATYHLRSISRSKCDPIYQKISAS